MTLAKQMRIEFVHIAQLLTANITFPRITLAVTALVQKVERLIGKFDAAEQTLKHTSTCRTAQRHFRIGPRRCDGAVGCDR